MTQTAVVPLGEIADLQAGVGFPPDLQGRTSGDYPVAKVGDISRVGRTGESVISTADHFVDEIDLVRLKARPIPVGSVLFAKIGEAIRQNHRVIAGCQLLVDNNAMAAIPTERVESRYLFHFLRTVDFYALASATTVPALRKSDLQRVTVPLPPLPEQRRIAEILDKADALRAKRRAALAQLDTLTQAIFLDMFGDPATNPKGWPTMKFGRVCETRLGKMLDQKKQTGEHRRPYLRNANVQWFRFDLSSLLEMDFDEEDRNALRLEPGDLLICEGGEPGRAAVWRGALEECYFQKALHRARPHPNVANGDYLSWFLWFLVQRGKLSGVTSATIAHLTGEKLAVLPCMVPPLSLQAEFARLLFEVHGLERSHLTASAEIDNLFASLQHRAFRGEL